ncbi:MAG TPA: hypothetical protein VK928_09835, partial [Longimicrobiales bacterium]|nr:hypothetical protein [Longimicrobiales bacterium]
MNARRMVGVGVLAVWVVLMGWHARREYFKPAAERMAMGASRLAPGAHYFVIRMNDVAIGMAMSRLDTLPGGYVFTDEVTLDVPALGSVHRALTRTRIELGPSLELTSFRASIDSEIGEFIVSGEAEGDSAVNVVMDAGGGPQRSRMRVSEGLLLDAALTLRMAASGALREGNEFTARVFDPSSMSERDVVVSVGERSTIVVSDSARMDNSGRWVATVMDTVPVWRVEQKFGGVAITNFVDEDGQIVRAESPLGFTIEREYYELARQAWRGAEAAQLATGYGALIEGTAISSNVDLGGVAEREELRVRLAGVDLAGFDLEGGLQRMKGDTLVVRRGTVAGRAAGYVLPHAATGDLAT